MGRPWARQASAAGLPEPDANRAMAACASGVSNAAPIVRASSSSESWKLRVGPVRTRRLPSFGKASHLISDDALTLSPREIRLSEDG